MTSEKRSYRRRTEDERIAELQAKIEDLRVKVDAKKRQDLPVITQIPKIKRHLLKFAQIAIDHGREDISNSTRAFLAGLERAADQTP